MNITLLERTRAILQIAGLTKSFWAEAIKTACYVINRSPSTTIRLKTSMEIWQSKPPDYSFLHMFGCPVYVIFSRDIIFVENELQKKQENNNTTKETTLKYMTDKSREKDSSEAEPEQVVQRIAET
ncbi:hypothetical protein AHAS_Ahas05G0153000 [Arachis hypogaea]